MITALAAAAMPAFLPEVVALFVAGAAIAYVCHRLGRSANGRVEWQTKDGRTLKAVQEAEASG